MNNPELSTTPATGTQNTAENPQTAGSAGNSRAVQPGTTSSLLDTTNGGVPLTNQALTSVNLPKTSASVAQPALPAEQSTNPIAIGFSILLFVIAAAVIVAIFLPVKTTTE